MKSITRNKILKEINNECVSLHKGDGYYYFTYDDGVHYETRSVYVMYLNQLSIEYWVAEAQNLIELFEENI